MKQLISDIYGKFEEIVKLSTQSSKSTRKQYDTAVSVAIGGFKKAVIVKNQATTQKCLEYLRSQNAGVATFLALDSLTVPEVKFQKNTRSIKSLLTFDSKFTKVIDYVCGSTIICDSKSDAEKYAFTQRIPVVTHDGTFYDPRGIITGPPSSESTILGHQPIEQIREEMQNIEQIISTISGKIESRRSEKDLREEKLDFQKSICHRYEVQRVDLRQKQKQLESDKRLMDRQIKEDQQKLDGVNKEIDEYRTAIAKIDLQKAEIDSQLFAEFCKEVGVLDIREFEIKQLSDYEARVSRRIHLQSRHQNLTTSIEAEKRRNTEQTVEQLKQNLDDLSRMKEETSQELIHLKDFEQEISKNIQELGLIRSKKLAEYNNSQLQIREIRKTIQERNREFESANEDFLNSDRDYVTAYQLASSILQQAKLSNIQFTYKAPFESVSETPSPLAQEKADLYELNIINFSSLQASDKVITSNADFEKRVKQNQKQIDAFEEKLLHVRPDLKSDNRFEDVEKELKEIEAESEKGKKESTQAKKEFEETKEKRKKAFMKIFNALEGSIDQVYKAFTRIRQLQRAGTAYLALEDTDEPYLGGVKYTAMPPHKRFRELGQMSGGEKAIASLALVVCIQNHIKAPFLLMDEPDASLDKHNLNSASLALKEMNINSQFITVSLRDRFFQFSDVLVGVYKDTQSGSSGTLTLDLNDYGNNNAEE